MATYDYKCYQCNTVVEVNKPMEAFYDAEHCKKCGERMRHFRGTRAPSAAFRGSGWTGARRGG